MEPIEDALGPAAGPTAPDGAFVERVIRVFVSSTFRDMQGERNHLVKVVFPELRRLAESRAVTWSEVDLRWGITEEEAAEGRALPLCLEEVERCRPYFIGLLGERYGSLPSDLDAQLVEAQPWLTEDAGRSVTELEILHGVLRKPQAAGRALFYFRDPAFSEDAAPERRGEFQSESDAARVKVAALKERIRAAHRRGELAVEPRENYRTLEQLGDLVRQDFTALIDRMFPADAVPGALDREAAQHEVYARSRRLAFVGRARELAALDRHVQSAELPLVLTGSSGHGKSALLAEWAARWRAAHPGDVMLQHYVGSSADSASWPSLVRRLLAELKRRFSLAAELPREPQALAAALDSWLAKVAGQRRIVIVLDALNQLSGNAIAQQLRWLPPVFPRSICVLTSALPGEALECLRARHWRELDVPAFEPGDIERAATDYLARFAKKPDARLLVALLRAPGTANPLYLRAVLDELRQFGDHAHVMQYAESYLSAPDLPALFAQILERWQKDYGRAGGAGDPVQRSLCSMACTRFGLSEAELLSVLGTRAGPLSRRRWTPLHLAMEPALVQRSGLLGFGHQHLEMAVRQRWLSDPHAERAVQMELASFFERVPEATDRKLDELPRLLLQTEQWQRLRDLLTDRSTFLRICSNERWQWELVEHWVPLGERLDAVAEYEKATPLWERGTGLLDRASAWHMLALFYSLSGRHAGAEPLYRSAIKAREHMLGADNQVTLVSVNNLAALLQAKGDLAQAESLYWRVVQAQQRTLGKDHPDTLSSVSNLATLLQDKGDLARTEALHRRTLEAQERTLGQDHPGTLHSVSNLASVLQQRGDLAQAELLCRRAMVALERTLGKDHPNTLLVVNNLASLLQEKGDLAQAELLCRRATEALERALGKGHPHTLSNVNNLASLLQEKGDLVQAESLCRRALEGRKRTLGEDHPDTLASVDNLALLLQEKRDLVQAEPLSRRALAGLERTLGEDHPHTLISVNNLAMLLQNKGDLAQAEPLYRRAMVALERTLGEDHSHTLISVNNLALLLQKKGDLAQAEPLLRRAMEALERTLGTDHPHTLTSVSNVALLLQDKGDLVRAEPLWRRALEGLLALSDRIGRLHPNLPAYAGHYISCLRAAGVSHADAVARLNAIAAPFGTTVAWR